MSVILYCSLVVAFLSTLLLTPKLIRFLEAIGVVGVDVQKRGRPRIAEMGGPAVLSGFLIGIFFYMGANVFYYGEHSGLIELFAAIATILMIALIGIFDDIGSLSSLRVRDSLGNVKRIGLQQWVKPLLTLPAAIPLMAIMAGDSSVAIPFLGPTNIGLLYPLLLIPIGVVGAANATNMLAGMNGLEAGLGSVLLLTFGAYALYIGSTTAAVIALVYAVTLLAFLRYNWYPARIMPGDCLNYSIGAVAATVAILGNFEKFALYCFSLWFLEGLLKARSRFKAENFGVLQADGTLAAPYPKSYSVTHLVMKLGRFTERQIVAIIIAVQIVICGAILAVSTLT